MARRIIRARRPRAHNFALPPIRRAFRQESPLDPALARIIDAQRGRLFEATAIVACLGVALDDTQATLSIRSPTLDHVANVLLRMLDSIAAELDPSALRRRTASGERDDRP